MPITITQPSSGGGGGGSGAPTGAKYVTSAAHADLSAEVIIPGLAGHADRNAVGGAGTSIEFDSGDSLPTWTAAVDAEDVNTTIPSHLYVRVDDNTERLGTYSWSPAAGFDLRMKMSHGTEQAAPVNHGLIIANSDNTVRIMMCTGGTGTAGYNIQAYTYESASYTQRGTAINIGSNVVYFRVTRSGTTVTFYWSLDGLVWHFMANVTLTITVAKRGFRIAGASGINTYIAVDWIRSDV